MRRFVSFTLALVLVISLSACCQSDSGFDLNGTWHFTFTVTYNTGAYTGQSPFTKVGVITLSGEDITINIDDLAFTGHYDPSDGTFDAAAIYGAYSWEIASEGRSGNTLSGTWRWMIYAYQVPAAAVSGTFTAEKA